MSKEAVLYSLFLSLGSTESASRNKKLVEKTKMVLVQTICKDAVMLSLGDDREYRSSLIKKPADDLESYISTGDSIRVNNAWVACNDHRYAKMSMPR